MPTELSPRIRDDRNSGSNHRPVEGRTARFGWFMMVCGIAMAIGIGLFLFNSGSSGSNLLLAIPLILCVGMHFLMHRHMGKPPSNNHQDIQEK